MESKTTSNTSGSGKPRPGRKDGLLENIARAIAPASREISDEELIDPGTNTPDAKRRNTGSDPDSGRKLDAKRIP